MRPNPDRLQTQIDSPLGPIILAASPLGLCGIWFTDQRHRPDDPTLAGWKHAESHPELQRAIQQLRAYFDGAAAPFSLPLDFSAGTPFQQRVWRALLEIPRGKVQTYSDIARHIGQAPAVRAVGAAIGRNPLSIVIPCHRVLGKTGALTGYAGGLHRKQALLQLEQADI